MTLITPLPGLNVHISSLRKYGLPALVFLLGLGLAIAAAFVWQYEINKVAESEFQRSTLRVSNEINQRFRMPVYGLNGLKSAYAIHPRVKRAEFRAAVDSRNMVKEFPGVRGFGFIEPVSRAHLGAFVAAEQADGAPQFAIRQLIDKNRDDLLVIRFIEPAGANVGVRGLDVGSEVLRRTAAQQAVDTGEPVMTPAITLVQDQRQSVGVLLYVPVYLHGADMGTVQERRAAWVGLLYAPIVIHELLDGVNAAATSPLDFELYQGAPENTLVFATHQQAPPSGLEKSAGQEPRFVSSQAALLVGQPVTLRMMSTPEFEASIDHTTPWLVFVGGALLSAMLAFMSRQLITGKRRAELLAEHMTEQLRHDEERSRDFSACGSDWSWETDQQHHFSYLSDNFEQFYGIKQKQLLNKHRKDVWAFDAMDPPEVVKTHLAQLAAYLPFRDFEYQVRVNNGELAWISVTGRPYFDVNSCFMGYRGIGSVITARKQAEEALLKAGALQKAIFESANFSSIATDARGVIQIFNVGAERMLGYTALEVMNRITPADISDPQEVIARAKSLSAELDTAITPGFEALVFKASRGIEDIYELSYIRKDGSRFPAVVSVTALRDHEDAIIGYLLIGTDNTARKEAEVALALEVSIRSATEEISNSWLRVQSAALDACGSALVIAGVNGVIQWVNPAFSQLSGYDAVEAVGHTPGALFKSGLQDNAFYEKLWLTVLNGDRWTGELINRRKDGTTYHERMTITSVRDSHGKVTHFIVVKEDLTDYKKREQVANSSDRAKSEFLANMSHEIRTPMNGVIGMVDILQQTRLEPMQSRMVATIQQSSMVLLNILNDILDFSKIEADKLSVERLPTHLRELLEGVAQLMMPTFNAKSIALTLFVSPALPQRIMTDPTRLRQVLLNLMGNAVKFAGGHLGKPAKVMLFVDPCTLALGQAGVKLRVIDSGIGISPEVMAKLFQPFMQADESTARKFGGTGLGLSISQRLVALLGGHISVRSELGEGAEFCVELPLEELPAGRMPVLGPSLQGVQVLVAIEDEELSNIVCAYALAAGAQMTVLPGLEEVCQHLQNLPPPAEPTVVVVDWESFIARGGLNLPSGVGVVKLVPCNQESLADAGSVCIGPLRYNDLICAVAQASGRFGVVNIPPLISTNALVARLAPSVEQALAIGQLVLLAEDNETNRDVMTEQLRLLGYATEVAEDGVQALSMWRTGRYGLLLTDCHMPHMDGFELTDAIRQAEPKGTRLPIVAITANAMQGEAERCRARGMDDYLSKPLRMVELAPMLQKWLPLEIPHLLSALAVVDAAPGQLAEWDATTLGQMVGDNPDLHRSLLEKFLVNAEQQALAIALSSNMCDFSAAADVAHALKSASRMVGALQLGELCEQIETAGSESDGSVCRTLSEDLKPTLARARITITEHLQRFAA